MEHPGHSASHTTDITYLLVVNGRPQGPYTVEELKAMHIKPGDFIRSADMDDYKEAHDVAALREILGFKKPHHIPQYFGSFDQRWLASFIDWFIVSGALVIFTASFVFFIPDQSLQLKIVYSLLVFIPVTNFVYHIVMESSPRQATIGKQLLKIKVCDLYGERISLSHATRRNLAKIFSVLTLFIGYLYSFFNPKQQCLHDVVAGTLVIKDRLV